MLNVISNVYWLVGWVWSLTIFLNRHFLHRKTFICFTNLVNSLEKEKQSWKVMVTFKSRDLTMLRYWWTSSMAHEPYNRLGQS